MLVIGIALAGAIRHTGTGTLCSLSLGPISFTCPLGFLQLALATRDPLFRLWLSVGLAILPILVLGRFFCAWICPVTLTRGGVKTNGESPIPSRKTTKQNAHSNSTTTCASRPIQVARKTWTGYSSYAILGASLLSSLAFGFPVFCLICPIGLTFGTLLAVLRLFGARQPSWELLLFPALLVVELVILRSWCRSLCPLGALLQLLGGRSRILRPVANKARCPLSSSAAHTVCRKACPEQIDLLDADRGAPISRCTRCLECYQRCPSKAIRLPPR